MKTLIQNQQLEKVCSCLSQTQYSTVIVAMCHLGYCISQELSLHAYNMVQPPHNQTISWLLLTSLWTVCELTMFAGAFTFLLTHIQCSHIRLIHVNVDGKPEFTLFESYCQICKVASNSAIRHRPVCPTVKSLCKMTKHFQVKTINSTLWKTHM